MVLWFSLWLQFATVETRSELEVCKGRLDYWRIGAMTWLLLSVHFDIDAAYVQYRSL